MTEPLQWRPEAVSAWRKSFVFDGVRIGLVPPVNSVVALNDSAAAIWDLLIETRDPALTASLYRDSFPARTESADEDVKSCVALWQKLGLFHIASPCSVTPLQESIQPSSHELSFCSTLDLGGTTISIEIEDPELAALFRILTQEFRAVEVSKTTLRATGSSRAWCLLMNGKLLRRANSLMLIRGLIVAEMLNTAAAALPAHAMIHGAALAHDGTGILLTGTSGAGKSTLAAVMVAKGWQLAAEDCAIFDGAMRIAPIPFALSVKSGSVSTLRRFFPDLDSAQVFRLGHRLVRYQPVPLSRRATTPIKPRMIVDVRYRTNLSPTEVISRPLSPLEALRLFLTEESRIDFEQDDGVTFLKFVEETPAYALEFGNAEAAEETLRNLLNGLEISCAGIGPGLPVSDRETT